MYEESRPRQTSLTGLDLTYLHFQTVLDEATEPWGIKVERVEM